MKLLNFALVGEMSKSCCCWLEVPRLNSNKSPLAKIRDVVALLLNFVFNSGEYSVARTRRCRGSVIAHR